MDDKAQAELKEVEAEVNAVLEKHNCGLQPVIVLTDGNVQARINVLKLPDKTEEPAPKTK